MTSVREKAAAILLMALVIAVNMAGLWPELTISRIDLNDNVFHFTLIEGMIQSVEQGGNPLDFWSPEWSFGYPVLRTYQPLAHGLVVLVYFGLGKAVSAMTVFVWVRFLSVALLPLTFFATARLISLGPLETAAAGLLAPLVSTNFLYGVEYGSYIWSGNGLFTQAVATHFLLLTIGFAFAAIRTGRRLGLAGIFLGLRFLSHFIYGYIGALTVCVLAVLHDQNVPRGVKIQRTLRLGAMAFLVAAFELIPMLRDAPFINHSRWEAAWKWDSFGAGPVLKLLFTGELLDHGRLPVLSLLALLGAGMCCWIYRQDRRVSPVHAFVLSGAALWLLMFFGRPFWGPLLTIVGATSDIQLHRVIGGLHIFLVLLAAIGLACLWRVLTRRWHWAVAALATAALLYPMVTERARLLSNNSVWGHNNLAAYESNRQALETTIATVRDRGGRVYPGLAATWGGKFKIGDVPFYAFLSEAQMPAVAFLYHAMALPADIMVRFNEQDPAQYRLFNIRTVVAPAQGVAMPAFLMPREQIGSFLIFDAPSGNYFDVVDALFAVRTTRNNFYDVNDRWLQSDWVAKKQHLQLDLGYNRAQLPRVDPEAPLFPAPALPLPGAVLSEGQNGSFYEAEVDATRASFALFRMTWHRNWKAYVDGRPECTVMLSPGFVGVPLTPGRHKIRARYEAGSSKAILAVAGFLLALIVSALPPPPVRLRVGIRRWMEHGLVRRFGWVAGVVALALPVAISVMTSRLPDGQA